MNPDLQRMVENVESAGYDCSPEGHERLSCPCGYSGRPEYVIPLDDVDELDDDRPLFVCPECGDA